MILEKRGQLFKLLNQFRYLQVDDLPTKSNIVGSSIDIDILALNIGEISRLFDIIGPNNLEFSGNRRWCFTYNL